MDLVLYPQGAPPHFCRRPTGRDWSSAQPNHRVYCWRCAELHRLEGYH